LDFDVGSLSKGLLRKCEDIVIDDQRRLTTWIDKPKANEEGEVEWFFPRGYRERPETVCSEKKADMWEARISSKLKMHCRTWADQCLGSFRTVVLVLWYDDKLSVDFLKHLALNLIFSLPKVKILFCSINLPDEDVQVIQSLKTIFPNRFQLFNDVPLDHICNILDQRFK